MAVAKNLLNRFGADCIDYKVGEEWAIAKWLLLTKWQKNNAHVVSSKVD